MNDGGAKTEETLLRVAEIGGRGRSLVAAQSLRAGQVILRESPLLLYSAFPFLSSSASSYCDHCFRLLSQSAQKCQSCSVVSFCSPNCFVSHTPWLCESLRRIHQSSSAAFAEQSPERQVQARFLLSAYNLAAASPSDFQILLSLQGSGCNGDSTSDSAAANFLHSLLSSVCPPLPVPISPELTAALLAKDKVNGFGLMEPCSVSSEKRWVRAYGIYPKTSFFNHDCLPNACRFDYVDSASDGNTDIIIRMIHDVPEGREVCLSYFPVNMNFSSRQKRLLEDYGFKCDCDRCKVESSWSEGEEDEKDVMEEMDGEDEQQEMDGEDEQEEMDGEDEQEEMDGEDEQEEMEDSDSSFPHSYFFMRYMCEKENCFGTLAPLPPKTHDASAPSRRFLECNVCGSVKEDEVGGNP